MVQSQQVLEWMAEGEAKGRVEGRAEGKAESLLQILELKFSAPPADLASAIRQTTDLAKLGQWTEEAVKANSLATFRQAAQI